MRNSHTNPTLSMYFLVELNTSKILFPHVINEWNKFDPNIRSSSNYHIFLNAWLKFIRPFERKNFNINDPFGIKMVTRLRLGFSHDLCPIALKLKPQHTISCAAISVIQTELLGKYSHFLFGLSDSNLISLLLYGDKFDDTKNRKNIVNYQIH